MEKKKTILCFVGRSNAGKDTLANWLSKEYRLPIVCSYADRPMRPTERQDIQHHFVSKKEMDRLLKREQILAFTHIKNAKGEGYRYCTTVKQIQEIEGDTLIYIIDPNGIVDLQKRFNDIFQLVTVYVTADGNIRSMRSITRGDLNFKKRNEDEDKEFSEFENCIQDVDIVIENNSNVNLAFQELVLQLKKIKVL